MKSEDMEQEAAPELIDLIERQLGILIRCYQSNPTRTLGRAVVRQLEILLRHPDCIGYPEDRCGYQKMLQQWRALVYLQCPSR